MTDTDTGISAILEHLKLHPQGVSVSEMAEALHISRNTIARYLDKLLLSGRVEMRNFGKAKVFYLSRRVPVSSMLNLSSEMVLVVNSSLEIIQANKTVSVFFSCQVEELVGKCIYEGPTRGLCQGDLINRLREGIQGKFFHDELILESSGEDAIIDLRVYPIVFPDGNPGVTLILEDITERVRVEETVVQNEALFRRILETVHDVLWSVDPDGIITYISPGITRVSGHIPEDLMGKPLSSLITSHEAERFMDALFEKNAKKNGFSLHEMPLIGVDGSKHYADITASPIYSSGENPDFMGYSGALHDITGRYEAERGEKRWRLFLNAVMENIPAVITVSDRKTGQYYYVNREAEHFFRLSRGELMQMTIYQILEEFRSNKLVSSLQVAVDTWDKVEVSDKVTVGKKEFEISARFVPMKLSSVQEYIIAIFFVDMVSFHNLKIG